MSHENNALSAAAIGVAEKSFFNSKLVEVAARGIPVAKELIPLISILVVGVQDSKEMQQLRKIYGELGKISAEVGNIDVSTVYLSAINSIKQKVTRIYHILKDKKIDAITDAELKELCNFLTPGIGATISGNYKSCISDVIRTAYGVELDRIIETASQSPLPLGEGRCQAVAMNEAVLKTPTGIIDYLNKHLELATEVTTQILSVCLAANDAYTFLKNNEAAIKDYFKSVRMAITLDDVLKTIGNTTVKADIGDITSVSFLSKLLFPTLATAPAKLCGTAYRLVAAMKYNATESGQANTNISIGRKEGYIRAEDDSRFRGDGKALSHATEYTAGQTFWTASFSNNNKVSNFINLAGPHRGFLGMIHTGNNVYVYEITGNTAPKPRPTYEWGECIWEVKVRHNAEGKMIFMFINKEFRDSALANNHGFLLPTRPGHYRFEVDNPDEYWDVKMAQ